MKLTEMSQEFPIIHPEPIKAGQIWEVSRQVFSPLELTPEEQQHFYSPAIFDFLNGDAPPRYVMIVTEPEPEREEAPGWQIVSVMLLSVKTDYLSFKNLLIPTLISGLEQDLIAETWNVIPMLTCNLFRGVGKRLSRKIYDLLLDVGDFEQGFLEQAPTPEEILALGLKRGTAIDSEFNQQEFNWKTLLELPVAAYYLYVKSVLTLDETLLLEQLNTSVNQQSIPLSQWFQGIVQTGWQTFEDVFGIFSATPALEGWRGQSNPQFPGGEADITQIETLVQQIQTTDEDDRLWDAVATLRQLQPHHPALGVRKVKSIQIQDISLVLILHLISRGQGEVRILVQVVSPDSSPVPKDLKVMILDENREIVLEDTAENKIVSIALKGLQEEKFSVKIITQDDFILEDFNI